MEIYKKMKEKEYQQACIHSFLAFEEGKSLVFPEKGVPNFLDQQYHQKAGDKESKQAILTQRLFENFGSYFEKYYIRPTIRFYKEKREMKIEVREATIDGSY